MDDNDDSIELLRRRRRRHEASRRTMWVLVGGGVVGLLVGGIVIAFALKLAKQRVAEAARRSLQPDAPAFAPPLSITAEQLAAETSGNPTAVLNHKAKTFRVTGKLREVTANIHGQCFLTFQTERGSSPRFFFPNPADVSHLKPNQIVTVEGDVYTDGGVIDIGPCRILKVESPP